MSIMHDMIRDVSSTSRSSLRVHASGIGVADRVDVSESDAGFVSGFPSPAAHAILKPEGVRHLKWPMPNPPMAGSLNLEGWQCPKSGCQSAARL